MSKRSQKPQPPWIDSYDLTRATYANWFNRLYDLALARFKWEGLEDSPFWMNDSLNSSCSGNL